MNKVFLANVLLAGLVSCALFQGSMQAANNYQVRKNVKVTGLSRLPPNLDALNLPVITYSTYVVAATDNVITLNTVGVDGSLYGGPVNQPQSFTTSNVDDFYSYGGEFVALFLTGTDVGQPAIAVDFYDGNTMQLILDSAPTFTPAVGDVISIQMNTTWWYNDSEETWISVNPTNPCNIIIVTRQDLFGETNGTGFPASIIMYSNDGGTTWNQSNYIMSRDQGATTFHAAGNFTSSSNIKVSFDPQGNAYACSTAFNLLPYFVDGVEVQDFLEGNLFAKSTDGGKSWTMLYTVEEDDGFNHFLDQPIVYADPYRKNRVYIVCADDLDLLGTGSSGLFIQTSFDAGENWTEPFNYILTAPQSENPGLEALSPAITVVNDNNHTILIAAQSFPYVLNSIPADTASTIYLSRSTDGGKNWTQSTIVPAISGAASAIFDPLDPNTLFPQLFSIPILAASPTSNRAYLTFAGVANNGTPDAYPASVIMMSQDSGQSWTTPKTVSPLTNQECFFGGTAVAENGTVAVLFYDFRNAQPDSDVLATDAWVSLWTPDLQFIKEIRLTESSFNVYAALQREAQVPGTSEYISYYLGDYNSIAAHGNDFYVSYSVVNQTYGCPPLPLPPSAAPSVNGFQFDPIPRNSVQFAKISARSCDKCDRHCQREHCCR